MPTDDEGHTEDTGGADDGTHADEAGHALVDEGALRTLLAERLGDADTLRVERIDAGYSNETLELAWGDRELVLRRPPPGETADTAHDVLREYRVIDALQESSVPVPPTVLACEDASVIGSQFYLMERVDGVVIREAEPERFGTPAHREAIGAETVDTLAAIHNVDYEAVGLDEFGHPEGFAQRQVKRWSEQFTWAFGTTAEAREVPAIYELMEWLGEHAPAEHPHTLVHGDYKLDNVLFAPGTPPELAAVFDWEMATLGDPRTDLGWLLSFWHDPGDPPAVLPDLEPTFTAREGYPARRELVARWEERTGLSYEYDRFYRTLAVYKLAGLGEMFFARYLRGHAEGAFYARMETAVPELAERALRIAEGEEPL